MTQVFEVLVRGRMSPQLAQALDGFTVQPRPGGLTSILGPIDDQPRLLGLLGAFDDLHIEVISVNPVPASDAGSPGQGDAGASAPG
ncbi:MAG: hypothetical protein ACRDVF_08955 [Microbacterium sp.]|jgi:hypothetical protein|uniref:hypothetical protein n=1 Tax=unclassified Microbacterium TaxID=2609290 RepID=UPI0006F4DD5C|nr:MULTISPECIES: hypothetical protein [unclassified Microbacterium]KRD51573.1 hypothetical protein ASE34_06330 [Microbacterium sp. Root280D1]CAH0172282.1 hypothetical protein SRABI98_01305 [Microbacterium sp. Bi98]